MKVVLVVSFFVMSMLLVAGNIYFWSKMNSQHLVGNELLKNAIYGAALVLLLFICSFFLGIVLGIFKLKGDVLGVYL